MFSGPDYLSTGEVASPTNWGNPELASDFFKADKALRLAHEAQAKDDVTGSIPQPLRRPAPEAAPRQQVAAPAPAPATATRRIETLPGDIVEPHNYPVVLERPITPYDFGQAVSGQQITTQMLPHFQERPGFGQVLLNNKTNWADAQPEVPTSNPQKYTLPEAALAPPAPQAEVNRAVSLARETIPSADEALAAVERLHNAGIYSGPELDKAGEILGAHLRARDAGIPVEEALRLSRAEGPMLVNQGIPREERPAAQPLAYSPEAPAAPAAAAIDKLTARAPQGPDLTDRQRDLIIRTIAAETSGKSPEESQAIAHVILNRIQSGKYGASPEAVLFARKQFEPWSNPNGANYPMRFSPESRRYGLGQEALDAALGSEDITKGATNFWAPKAQAALGRRPPKWGRTGGVDIGETRFHNLSRADGGLVDDALHVVREHHADGEAVGKDDPRQWLQFGGQDMERAPAGLPIGQAVGTSAAYHTGESLADAAKLANQVQAGEVDPMSDEGVQRALSAAMAAQTGGLGGVSARAGETVLGAGPVRKAAQDEVSGLFDYSRLHEVPKVPQFDLPRNIPPRGVPERVNDLFTNQAVKDKMADVISEGQRMGGANWYNTDPLLEKFVQQLGPDAGQKAYRKYMDFVAATSPRSDVGTNIRNASYYYGRDMRGEGMPAVGDRNPQPYGHMAQRLHQMNAERVAGPGWDPLNNPKPASFVENLAGNQEPVTVDTHAFRLPAILAQDPRFLETAYQASKDAPKLNIQKLVQSGDMSIEDALKMPAYWQAQPKANEYGAMERYYKPIGRELGMTPAQTQASAWVGGGKLTGLASDESKPFMRFFDDRVMKTARETGMDPKDVLRNFISGKAPLYAKGGSVEDRALMLVSRQA
jgi:hypothetical protein